MRLFRECCEWIVRNRVAQMMFVVVNWIDNNLMIILKNVGQRKNTHGNPLFENFANFFPRQNHFIKIHTVESRKLEEMTL